MRGKEKWSVCEERAVDCLHGPGGPAAKFGVQPCNCAGGHDLKEMGLIHSGGELGLKEEWKTGPTA